MYLIESAASFQELVLLITRFLCHDRERSSLTKFELEQYMKIINDNLLLKILLEDYMPFSNKWGKVIQRSIRLINSSLKQNIHNKNFLGKRVVAKAWLREHYSHGCSTEEELQQLCSKVLEEVELQIANGMHDITLELQEKERGAEKEGDAAIEENRPFNQKKALSSLQGIAQIKENFKKYFDLLRENFPRQSFAINEIASLYQWILKGEELSESNKWSVLVEILDEARTAYFAGGSFDGKKYSCPEGLEDRILDRVFSIKESLLSSPRKIRLSNKKNITEEFVDHFVRAFICKNTQTNAINPSNFLYQAYLKAKKIKVCEQKHKSWVLIETEGNHKYEAVKRSFIQTRIKNTTKRWDSYLSKPPSIEKRALRSTLMEYTRLANDIEELIPLSELEKKFEKDFFSKIRLIKDNFDYAEILKEDWLLFKEIFKEQEITTSVLKQDEIESDEELESFYERLGSIIGFGIEHVRLLTSIIEPSESLNFWKNNDILFLRECVQGGVIELHKNFQEPNLQEWYRKGVRLYKKYFLETDGEVPLLVFSPTNFWMNDMIDDVIHHISSLGDSPLTGCSFGVLAELVMSGRIVLDNFNEKVFLFDKACKYNYYPLIVKILNETESGLWLDFNIKRALDYAIYYSNITLCDFLISKIHNHDIVNQGLLIASAQGDYNFILYFLNKGADILSNQPEGNALILAIKNGHDDLALSLLKLCPWFDFINAEDKSHNTALHYAVFYNCPEIVRALLDILVLSNQIVKDSACYYLRYSCKNKDTEILSLLLTHPYFKESIQHYSIETAKLLDFAIMHSNTQAIEILLQNGLKISPSNPTDYMAIEYYSHIETALMSAVKKGSPLMVELLLKSDFSSEFVNKKHHTKFGDDSALDIAFYYKKIDIIEILMAYGAEYSPSRYNQIYNTISSIFSSEDRVLLLEDAVREHDFAKALNFVQSGVVGSPEALNLAVLSHQAAMVNLLLSSGAPLPRRRKRASNILMDAVYSGDFLIVKMLLPLMKEDLEYKDSQGKTALVLAQEQGYSNIEELLKKVSEQYLESQNKTIFSKSVEIFSSSYMKKHKK